MNYNPTPKSTYQTNANLVKTHHALVERPDLRYALEVALLQMQRELYELSPADMGSCASAHLRMTGAEDFLKVFLNLAETPSSPTKSDVSNLPSNLPSPRK